MEPSCNYSRLSYRIIKTMLAQNEIKLTCDSKDFKDLRNCVKNNQATIPEFVNNLFTWLEKWESDTRHAALLVCDYFFHRSHLFRVEIIEKLPEFLELVAESNPLKMPLPPPVAGAKTLKTVAIKTIRMWYDKFQAGYKGLEFVNQFLQHSKSIDYERATAAVEAERTAKERQQAKEAIQNSKKVINCMTRINNASADIERVLYEVENGLKILVPVFVDDTSNENMSSDKSNVQLDNFIDEVTVFLTGEGPIVTVTEDNESVVQVIKDGYIMLDHYRNNVTNALSILQKCGANQHEITTALDLKNKITKTMVKIDELKLSNELKKTRQLSMESDSENSDLEDVPEKQLEDFVTPYEVPKYIIDKIAEDINRPCCSKSLELAEKKNEEGEVKKSNIPILPYGLDLKYWGEQRGQVEAPINNFNGHHFWRPPDDDGKSGSSVASDIYKTRIFTYVGEEIRPMRECRSRLADGKLCPRRDKTKCPVHGPIISRDDEGFPVSEIIQEKTITNINEEDDELIRDIEMATGKDLSFHKKKKHQRYTVHEGKVVRDRLEKKLLDKRSLKRIGATLDAIQKARIEKKYGNQFVHALHK